MKPKLLMLSVLIVLPLLYWLSNYAAEQVLDQNAEAQVISTNGCQFGKDVCQIKLQKQSYLVSVVNDFTAGQAIQIEVEPKVKQVASVKPLQNIQLLLQGKTMYMGISEAQLQYVDGKWVGLLRIPFCTTDVMLWQLDMTIKASNGSEYMAKYEFEMRHG